MTIKTIKAKSYKAFSQEVSLALGKVTVVFGRNNSGKTSLVRLPIFTLASLTNPVGFLSLTWKDLTFGDSFSSLCHPSSAHPKMSFGLETDQGEIRLDLQQLNELDGSEVVIPTRIRRDHGEFVTRVHGADSLDDLVNRLHEDLSVIEEVASPFIEYAEYALKNSLHIRSSRPSVLAAYTTRRPRNFGADEVPYMLSSDSVLEDSVDRWFSDNLDGIRIRTDKAGFAFRLLTLSDSGAVPLSMAGRGTQSALPVVALLIRVASGDSAGGILGIEEPEEHLHPSAHGAMADLCIQAAQKKQIVIETHSENFILRLRRRLAEGILAQEDLRLYYVDEHHQVTLLDVHQDGFVENWPIGVFESDIEETRAMVEARFQHVRDGDD